MRIFFLAAWLTAQSVLADWKSDLVVYWMTGHPSIAITSSNIFGIEHAAGSFTGVSIGDQTGPLSGLCTGFVTDGVCGGSVQNCTWTRRYRNSTNDAFLYRTCRPLSSGISYVATNTVPGTPVQWLSIVDRVWYTGTVFGDCCGFPYTFPDGMVAYYGVLYFDGHMPVAGDSDSPLFARNQDGVHWDFAGAVAGTDSGHVVAYFLWPEGVQYRPSSPAVISNVGLSQLFNSDPDR